MVFWKQSLAVLLGATIVLLVALNFSAHSAKREVVFHYEDGTVSLNDLGAWGNDESMALLYANGTQLGDTSPCGSAKKVVKTEFRVGGNAVRVVETPKP
jgi:hypothetical protein